MGGVIVHVQHHEARLDPCDIERPDAGGHDAVIAARSHQRVPHRERAGGRDPQLVAEVARVTGARNLEIHAGNAVVHRAEVPERVHRIARGGVQYGARQRTLQRERAERLGDLLDRHLHAEGIAVQPAQAGLRRRQAVVLLAEPADRAVVDHLAVPVAPARIEHLARPRPRHIAGDDAVQQPRRIGAGDPVLVQRRNVDERRGVADRRVLALVRELVAACGGVAGPAAPGLPLDQLCRARVKGRGLEAVRNAHRGRGPVWNLVERVYNKRGNRVNAALDLLLNDRLI
jgi:hypothetical protein